MRRSSPQRSTAPASTVSSSPAWRARTPISSARMPEASPADTTKLGPPKRNARAMRLATMLPRAPRVRLAVRGGLQACCKPASHSSACGSSSRPGSVFRHSGKCRSRNQRRWKPVASKSKSIPITAPVRGRSWRRGRCASAMASAATFNISRCCGRMSGISSGGMLKAPLSRVSSSRKQPLRPARPGSAPSHPFQRCGGRLPISDSPLRTACSNRASDDARPMQADTPMMATGGGGLGLRAARGSQPTAGISAPSGESVMSGDDG